MMRIAIHDHESKKYPNLALMKLSAYHKRAGDMVGWFDPLLGQYDKIYSSKVFTWTQVDPYLPKNTIFGGTGFNGNSILLDEIEHIMPDYNLYETDKAYGFLTRGCPNKCSWCIVPEKEGSIKANAEITEFWSNQKEAVLLDNNVLASDHGLQQIEKIIDLGIKIDFNQGLDCRIIADNKEIAKLLSKVKWIRFLRMACDTKAQIPYIKKALEDLNKYGFKNYKVFVYVLVKNIKDALEIIKILKNLNCTPFAQPYRDFKTNKEPKKELKRFARWVNHKAVFKTVKWEDYKQCYKQTQTFK